MAALFALGVASGAAAQTMVVPVAAPVVSDWTGFYAGAWIGGRAGTINNTSCTGTCADDFPLNGFTGGLTAGYDYQLNSDVVIGGFVTLPLVRPTTTATIVAFPGSTWTVEPQFALAAGGRVGLVRGNLMPYALLGLGLANVQVTPNGPGQNASTATHVGIVAGVGAEYRLNDNWSIDGRYMLGYAGNASYQFCPQAACISGYDEVSHNFSIGINYRF
jgi:outer membrane immunogenic protein